MSLFAILGSGFGLYGYLPALASCGQRVVMSKRHYARFCARTELATFAKSVEWEADESAMLNRATGVVLALKPKLQCYWLTECLKYSRVNRLILEKPLADSPKAAIAIYDNLISSGKIFRIGYIFRYTNWGSQLLAALKAPNDISSLSIRWRFMANHFSQDLQVWKRYHEEGGGVIRFYGIQIIALLAEIGYCHVALSQAVAFSVDEYETWHAVFTGEGLPKCEVFIDSKSHINSFQVEHSLHSTEKRTLDTDLDGPFQTSNRAGVLDHRVSILNQLYRSLWEVENNEYKWYLEVIKLWLAVEGITLFEKKEKLPVLSTIVPQY